jgi:hypothetical protein
MKIRLNEAIAYAKMNGKEVVKKQLAAKLFPDSTPESQQVNLSYLASGRTKRVTPELIDIICDECGVTPNFLFGYEQ